MSKAVLGQSIRGARRGLNRFMRGAMPPQRGNTYHTETLAVKPIRLQRVNSAVTRRVRYIAANGH